MTYNVNEYSGNTIDLHEINSQMKIKKLNIPKTFNNLVPINDKYLIASEYKPDLYLFNSYLNDKVEDEKIYSIDIETEKYTEIKIKNYKEKIPFHPHGMFLYITPEKKYILYVINHAVDYNYAGQERIEKLRLTIESKEIILTYEESIILPKEFFLRVESISVIEEDLFYFTTNTPYQIPNDSDELLDIKSYISYIKNKLLKIIIPMLNIKKCFIYLYNKKNKGNKISIISESQSATYGGITYDKKRNLLYAIKPTEKIMNIFQVNTTKETKLIQSIPILYLGNNIFYDNKEDKIYIGINGKKSEEESIIYKLKKNQSIEDVETYSGYIIIDPENNYSINDIMVMKNDFKWINSAVEIKGKIYMSSIYSTGIFVSEKK